MDAISHKSLYKSAHNVTNDIEITKNFLSACKNGNKSAVKKYRSQVNDINVKEKETGNTALHIACINGHEKIARSLIKHGINIDEKNSEGFVALYYAIYNGLVNTVKILLDHESFMECLDKYDNSILHIACELGYYEIVKYLLDKNILNNNKNKSFRTPFHVACQKGYIDIIKLMLQRHDILIDGIDSDGKTGLILACEKNHSHVVKLLLNSDCNLFIRDNTGKSAIYYACKNNNTEIIKLLVDHQADITQNDNENVYPLHLVCSNGNLEMTKLFIETLNADIECKNNNGYTPLFLAYINHRSDVIKYLIDKGCNVDTQNKDGLAILHYCCMIDCKDSMKQIYVNVPVEKLKKKFKEKGSRTSSKTYLLEDTLYSSQEELSNFVNNKKNNNNNNSKSNINININSKTSDDKKRKFSSKITLKRLLKSKSSGKIELMNESKTKNNTDDVKNKRRSKSSYFANENINNNINNINNTSSSINKNINNNSNSNLTSNINENENKDMRKKKSKSAYFSFGRKSKQNISGMKTSKSSTPLQPGKNEKNETMNSTNLQDPLYSSNLQRSLNNIKKNLTESRSSLFNLRKSKSRANSSENLPNLNNNGFSNELEFITLLLDSKANINIKDNDGNTPLMVACAFRRKEQINLLLKRGAYPNDLNKEGMGPLDFICFDKELGVIKSEINMCDSGTQENLAKLLVSKEQSLSNTINKDYKYTPLHLACHNNNLELIKFLLERGIDINCADCYGNTPFLILCKKKFHNVIEELLDLKYNIDMNVQNSLGKTGMHYACQNQDIHIIKLLLKNNVNLNLKDSDGNNPLHIACKSNNIEVIKLLLNHLIPNFSNSKSDGKKEKEESNSSNNSNNDLLTKEMEIINALNNNNESPIFLILQNSNVKIINKLLYLPNIDISSIDNINKNSLLHLACERELANIVQSLIAFDVDPNIQNQNKDTPLHIACKKNNLDLINVLLNAKSIDVNIQNNDLETPLHISCNNKSEDICQFLLDKEIKLDILDKNGHIPLFIACKQGLYKVVKKIIKLNPDVLSLDPKGYTPLHIACAYERTQIVKLLLENNADINAKNPYNSITPLDIVNESQNKNLLNLIENKKEVKLKKPSVTAIKTHSARGSFNKSFSDYKSEALTFMFSSVSHSPSMKTSKSDNRLKNNLDSNNNSSFEEATSPLHQACEKGFEIKVRIFLDYGDDINSLDNFDNSPLHYACTYNMINIAKILIKNPKININIKCCQSRITPFLSAAYNKNVEMMELLLNNGANVNACDSNGCSALFNLCKDENVEIYKVLLSNLINTKIQDKSGMTILHLIAMSNKKELAPLIIEYDPSIIDYQDIYGRTALHYASINNYKEIIQLLIRNKASVDIKDKKKLTPIDYMKDNDYYTDEIKELIKSIEIKDNKDFMVNSKNLIQATKKNDIKEVKNCLKKLKNLYYIDGSGRIALHYACEIGNVEIVKLLLMNKSPINIYDNKYITPLYLASLNGFDDIAKLLLDYGASSNNVDIKTFNKIERLQQKADEVPFTSLSKFNNIDEYLKSQNKTNSSPKEDENKTEKVDKTFLKLSSTPLISAILNGQNDIVETLINSGCNINEKDSLDLNPFFYACSINNEKAIKLLLDKKVEIENYCDPMKTSIMHFACKYGNIEVAENIINCFSMFQGNISQSSIHLHSSHRDGSFERYCGVNEFNRPNLFGVTPFHWACLYGQRNIIKLFKESGLEIFQEKDINGNNALHHACNSGNYESVRLVLKYINNYNTECYHSEDSILPIQVNERNNEGQSALHIAVTKLNEDIIRLLVDNGVDRNLLNNKNQTAKEYAESLNITNKTILDLLEP